MNKFTIVREIDSQKMTSGDEEYIFKQLKWCKMFAGSNQNVGSNYDPQGKRDGLKLTFTGNGAKLTNGPLKNSSILTPLDRQNI